MSPEGAIAIVGAAVVVVLFARWTKSRISDRVILNMYPVGYIGLFVGLFIPHWEVGRFVWFIDGTNTERWGSSGNCCKLVVDDSALASAGVRVNKGRDDAPAQYISFRGEILEIGSFGHAGICRYRIKVVCDLVKTSNA